MDPGSADGIRVEHQAAALSRLPLPPTANWAGGAWYTDVMTVPPVRLSLFAPRGTAFESSFDQDELYLVVSGSAILTAGQESFAVDAGDAIHVPANTPHRFTRLTADLCAWMVWLPLADTDVREVAREFMRAWIDRDQDRLRVVVADDCEFIDSSGQLFVGFSAVRAGLFQFTLPDATHAHVELGDPQVMGDHTMIDWTVIRSDGALLAHGTESITVEDDKVHRCDSFRKVLAGRPWPPTAPTDRHGAAGSTSL